jgi:mitochondrial inner membrane protease subunit 1
MTRVHLTHRRAALDAGACLLTALVLVFMRVRPRRFVVSGLSMVPTLDPEDRLLVARIGRPKPGDLVVFRDPRAPSHLLCKRVLTTDGRHIVVRGDNPEASTDSRAFGPVPEEWVVGRVLRRYWPRADARRF